MVGGKQLIFLQACLSLRFPALYWNEIKASPRDAQYNEEAKNEYAALALRNVVCDASPP